MSEEDYQELKKKKNAVVLAGNGAVKTVTKNMSQFSDQQVQKATQARKLQAMLAYLSDQDLKNIIRGNMLKNCEVTVEDATTAFKIFGSSAISLKGKSTTKKDKEVAMDQVL
eukprot:10112436-Ditylum_brightwellii.AAC.1